MSPVRVWRLRIIFKRSTSLHLSFQPPQPGQHPFGRVGRCCCQVFPTRGSTGSILQAQHKLNRGCVRIRKQRAPIIALTTSFASKRDLERLQCNAHRNTLTFSCVRGIPVFAQSRKMSDSVLGAPDSGIAFQPLQSASASGWYSQSAHHCRTGFILCWRTSRWRRMCLKRGSYLSEFQVNIN